MIESPPPISTVKRFRSFFIGGFLVIALFASYGGGYVVGRGEVSRPPSDTVETSGKVGGKGKKAEWLSKDVEFGVYWDVWEWLQDHYIDRPIAEPKLLYGSLAGLVASLGDPYSVFLEPKDAEDFNQELQGTFDGIGAEIGIRENKLTIISPLTESPAETVGLKPMDWILKIDEIDTNGINLEDAVRYIRGPRGSQVTLRIMREGFDEPKEFAITRDIITIVSVTYELKEGAIGYIKISNFHADTNERVRNAVHDLLSKNVNSVILDMRNNPGGYLNSAVDIASYWVAEGTPIVLERTADQKTREFKAARNQVFNGMPTVVLVNRGSASASEIVAGALQDYKLATIVGEQTFGKGSIQELQEFSGGAAVKLTVARWLTPKERQIDREGISPDTEVKLSEEDTKADKDPQMEKALEILADKESGITNKESSTP